MELITYITHLIIEINGTLYNIQWEDKHLIVVDNNGSKIDTPPFIGESAKPVITSYLACLVREERFLLVQCTTESCLIPKSFEDVTGLLADIQKK